jgi:hypothetical protein
MSRCVKMVVVALAGVGLLGSAALARDGSGFRGGRGGHAVGARFHQPFGDHVRGHRGFFRRGFVPLYLDNGDWYGDRGMGDVVIQQTFITQTPRGGFSGPTTSDLPVVLGIREVKPDQPSVIVLGETGRSVASEVTGSVAATPRVSAGPRIIHLGPNSAPASVASDESRTGARIIELGAPVGR